MRDRLAILVLATAGVAMLVFAGSRFATMGDPAPLPSPTATVVPTETPDLQAAPTRTHETAPEPTVTPSSVGQPASRPVELSLSSQEISGPVIPVDIDYDINELEIPEDVDDIGWYEGGAPVGAEHGTTLLTAHVNTKTQGWGAFANLYAVEPGDEVAVTGEDGSIHTYRAQQVVAQPKDALDQTVFDAAGDHRLVLVTCGGEMKTMPDGTRSHEDNVVVYATPTD